MTPPPAAKTSPLERTVSALETAGTPPSTDHVEPFQRATPDTGPPAAETATAPPASKSPFGATASESTAPGTPVPIGDHATPSQRAMLLAATPPIVVNVPPAITSPFGIVTSA